MTVLFADVVRSMDMAAALGPERLRDIMARLFDGAGAVVRRYGGAVDKFTGDGLMALFGAPLALENHALQACRTALEIQSAVRDLTNEVAERDGITLQLRIGLNSGEVVAGEIGSGAGRYTAIGDQVGMAQRMESVAPPNGVMLSESTARLVEADAHLGEPELVTIKGAADPVSARRLFSIADRADTTGRVDVPLVGRHWEMAAVAGLLGNAVDGRGAVLGVAGPPGIGKSRLTRELSSMAAEQGVDVVVAYCESHTSGVPFHLATQLLRAAFEIADLQPAAARARIREEVPDASSEDLLLLEDLVGASDPEAPLPQIDPDARRRRISALLNTATLARERPVLFIIEDAHWIDEISESMLTDFLPVVPLTPTLFVITYRPEYRGALAALPGAQTVALAPLSDSDTGALVAGLLGDDPSLAELAAAIMERAAGNPFFAEEIVRELSQRGVLQGDRGQYRTTLAINEIRVPATLQATIASRIDRLTPAAKRTLGAAAVIGSRFDPGLLRGLAVDSSVDELLDAQLIDQVQFTPGPVYAFHHPMIRSVAYESQLVAVRNALHRRLAEVIEQRGRPDEDAALIAEHLEAAGDLRAAYDWQMRAGAWANYRSITAAHASWQRAAVIADRLDNLQMRIAPRTLICGSAWRVGGSGAESGFEELRQLCEGADDPLSLAVGMAGQVATLFTQAHRRDAVNLASELVELVKAVDSPSLTVSVVPLALVAMLEAGNVREVASLADMTIAAAAGDPREGEVLIPSPLALTIAIRGNARWWIGERAWREDFETARSLCSDEPLARAGVDTYVYSGAIPCGALTADAAVVAHTAEVLELAEQVGDQMTLNIARTTRGLALIYSPEGDTERGVELLLQVREEVLADRYSYSSLPLLEAEIARAEASAGNFDHGIDRLTSLIDELFTQSSAWAPLVSRVLVEILLRRGAAGDLSAAGALTDRVESLQMIDDLALRQIFVYHMRALVSRAQGDDAAYRTHRDRYREMANALGFEGHMQWAAAMP